MKVAIIGLGLIGGSIGASLKKNKICSSIIGFEKDYKRVKKAKDLGIIDEIGNDFNCLKDIDVIFLALPVLSIIEIGKQIKDFINNAIVSDVGSTKELIVKELSIIKRFIGGHPLTGSHKSGIENATSNLFTNSTIVLTPNESVDIEALDVISSLWKKMGAHIIEMPAHLHDELVALSSHVPHITSNILVELIMERKDALPLIASSFRDITRLSLSDPIIWKDIFLTNKGNIIKWLDRIKDKIIELKEINEERLINKLQEINKMAKEIYDGKNG